MLFYASVFGLWNFTFHGWILIYFLIFVLWLWQCFIKIKSKSVFSESNRIDFLSTWICWRCAYWRVPSPSGCNKYSRITLYRHWSDKHCFAFELFLNTTSNLPHTLWCHCHYLKIIFFRGLSSSVHTGVMNHAKASQQLPGLGEGQHVKSKGETNWWRKLIWQARCL